MKTFQAISSCKDTNVIVSDSNDGSSSTFLTECFAQNEYCEMQMLNVNL